MYYIVKDGKVISKSEEFPRFKNGVLVYPTKILDIKEDEVSIVEDIDGVVVSPIENFEDMKSEKLQELKQWHDEQTSAMKAKYSQSEVDSFLDKRTEAMAWRVDNMTPTPYIDAMVGYDAEAKVLLIQAVLAKVDAAAQLEAYVLSKRDAIESCTTSEELEAITW